MGNEIENSANGTTTKQNKSSLSSAVAVPSWVSVSVGVWLCQPRRELCLTHKAGGLSYLYIYVSGSIWHIWAENPSSIGCLKLKTQNSLVTRCMPMAWIMNIDLPSFEWVSWCVTQLGFSLLPTAFWPGCCSGERPVDGGRWTVGNINKQRKQHWGSSKMYPKLFKMNCHHHLACISLFFGATWPPVACPEGG